MGENFLVYIPNSKVIEKWKKPPLIPLYIIKTFSRVVIKHSKISIEHPKHCFELLQFQLAFEANET